MADVIKCPNCNQPVVAGNEFCIFCGTKLPVAEKSPLEESSTFSSVPTKRICKNGHEFTDDKLAYCPVCGLPFEEVKDFRTEFITWTCLCGHVNSSESNFCEKCGNPKESTPLKRRVDVKAATEEIVIPEGMYTPTPDDLKPKKTR